MWPRGSLWVSAAAALLGECGTHVAQGFPLVSSSSIIGTHAGCAFLLNQLAGSLTTECLPCSLCGSKYTTRSKNREPVFIEAVCGAMVPQAMLLLQSEGGAISEPASWVFPTVEEGA